ncbi:MAG: hypothetical protein QXF61_10455 [Nitrososphaeria archaeon]
MEEFKQEVSNGDLEVHEHSCGRVDIGSYCFSFLLSFTSPYSTTPNTTAHYTTTQYTTKLKQSCLK